MRRPCPSEIDARRAFKTLADIPVPSRGTLPPYATVGLPILATRYVDDRIVQFGWVIGQPRLRLTLVGLAPPLLGHVTGLDGDEPVFHTSEAVHLYWFREGTRCAQILDISAYTWRHHERLMAEHYPSMNPFPDGSR